MIGRPHCNARASQETPQRHRARARSLRQPADREHQERDGASGLARSPRVSLLTWPARALLCPAPMPLISIVLPTHRRAHLLETALASVVNQVGFDDFEVAVSDNSAD